MGKKCLIVYSSFTGNTEKVALRFKSTFEKNGWECDIFKIRKKPEDILNPPFDLDNYDFLCVGSGVILHLPYNEILNVIRRLIYGMDPRIPLRFRGEDISYIKEPVPEFLPPMQDKRLLSSHRKIVLGPDSKKAVVFITYAGYEFGPKEAEPALQLLELEIEHLSFQCIGHFCCPGKFLNDPTPGTYHGDIRDRPDEKDLLKAEMFIEEKLEEIADRAVSK
jgi:hypothetical protein